MNEQTEIFDSAKMKVLGEFALEYDNDETITQPAESSRAKIFVGTIGENIIIASQSRNTQEITGDLIVEKQNLRFIAESIEDLLDREKPWEAAIERESGKDNLQIYLTNSWAHNLPAPLERINIKNSRNYELDGLRSRDWWLSLPPRMAQKLLDEIKNHFLAEGETFS